MIKFHESFTKRKIWKAHIITWILSLLLKFMLRSMILPNNGNGGLSKLIPFMVSKKIFRSRMSARTRVLYHYLCATKAFAVNTAHEMNIYMIHSKKGNSLLNGLNCCRRSTYSVLRICYRRQIVFPSWTNRMYEIHIFRDI